MKSLQKHDRLIDDLGQFDAFKNVEASALLWLIDKSDYVALAKGSYLFQTGDKIENMAVILEGQLELYRNSAKETVLFMELEAPAITGVLPFSRLEEAGASGRVSKELKILALNKKYFTEMVSVSYALVQNLVATMSNRIRETSHFRYQNEKMASLGKLSAGLAHELNNPASAMLRNADMIYQKLHQTPERFKAVMTIGINEAETDALNDVLFSKLNTQRNPPYTLLEKKRLGEDILDWLEDNDVVEPEDLAEIFVEFDFSTDDLQFVQDTVGSDRMSIILWWFESTLAMEKMLSEMRNSANQISSLVKSIKSYSHMDKSSDKELTNIHVGIDNTLRILEHKYKKKQIVVESLYDRSIPRIAAYPSQLNQIWTNIIDNAIDAMDKGGKLSIRSSLHDSYVRIEIIDNGHGIPEEILDNIFDPFFSTKGIGQGTGMGLEIVRRIVEHHKGSIQVWSKPGKTTFCIQLPKTNI